MTSLFTNSEQIFSYGESRDDELLGDFACGGDGATAKAGQVIAIGSDNLFYEAEIVQMSEVAGNSGCGQILEKRHQIGAANTVDVCASRSENWSSSLLERLIHFALQ